MASAHNATTAAIKARERITDAEHNTRTVRRRLRLRQVRLKPETTLAGNVRLKPDTTYFK